MIVSKFRWRLPVRGEVDPAARALGAERGISERLLQILAARGVRSATELAAFLAPAEEALHDPALLPDAAVALARVAAARAAGERVLVYGDFDADGLTGLSILVIVLRSLGLDAEPYVPERLGDGHGLSLRALDRAVAEGRTLILTADCGTSSGAEIALARERGIDVIVTDHHHAATWPEAAVAVVNPQRAGSEYPERELTGAGVAWKFAHLLVRELGAGSGPAASGPAAGLPPLLRELADLAVIGTVADVAPLLGENRAIAQIGLAQLRTGARPGLAAIVERAGLARDKLCADDIGFGIAPRINAAGRVGEAVRAARLLLATDRAEADVLATEIERANLDRREMTKTALAEARGLLGLDPGTAAATPPVATAAATDGAQDGVTPAAPATLVELPLALLVAGEWPVGIIGLIAGRLAEDFERPAIVATTLDADEATMRASCRSAGGVNLAEALIACDDLLIRHGGHANAAGFDIDRGAWAALQERFLAVVAVQPRRADGPRELPVDLVLHADQVDFALVKELALLDPCGPGNASPVVGITGLKVARVRPANGGHTQLVLRRTRDVLDAIAFRRPDLVAMLKEGDLVDVVARASSRTFGGFESMQLEIVDVSAAGDQIAPAS